MTGFLANSRHVAGRIERCYGRSCTGHSSTGGHGPVPAGAPTPPGITTCWWPPWCPYKKVERALDAFRGSGRRLRVIGEGPQRARLQRLAGPEVTFLGRVSEAQLVQEYQRCRALLMPGVEDAGIAPLEAMACGRPVIALDDGGVPEVIVPRARTHPPGCCFRSPA